MFWREHLVRGLFVVKGAEMLCCVSVRIAETTVGARRVVSLTMRARSNQIQFHQTSEAGIGLSPTGRRRERRPGPEVAMGWIIQREPLVARCCVPTP